LMRFTVSEVEQSPQLIQGIYRHLNRRLRQTEAFLALNGHRRVRDRLCQLLILLAKEIGQPVPQGDRLSIRLTHQHLANAIGTTRVTVTRLLGQLKDEGWLQTDASHHLIVPTARHLPLSQ
ncbi:MAG: Crp/Fnr family transcriptional regulator, partial [Leptolyngbyaceae bacterium]|nr:Crp/Fnr family transcriptional regulator [Leptolyngbyaceae bacterium]